MCAQCSPHTFYKWAELGLLGGLLAVEVDAESESLPRHLSRALPTGCPLWAKAALMAAPGQWRARGHGLPRSTSPLSWPPSLFIGSVPLDPELTRSLEEGRDFMLEFPQSPAFPALSAIAQKILSETPPQLS